MAIPNPSDRPRTICGSGTLAVLRAADSVCIGIHSQPFSFSSCSTIIVFLRMRSTKLCVAIKRCSVCYWVIRIAIVFVSRSCRCYAEHILGSPLLLLSEREAARSRSTKTYNLMPNALGPHPSAAVQRRVGHAPTKPPAECSSFDDVDDDDYDDDDKEDGSVRPRFLWRTRERDHRRCVLVHYAQTVARNHCEHKKRIAPHRLHQKGHIARPLCVAEDNGALTCVVGRALLVLDACTHYRTCETSA